MSSPYRILEAMTRELRAMAEVDNWESVALLVAELRVDQLPKAAPDDRAAIEAALNNIAAAAERAAPLRDDISRMLAAFGTPKGES